MSDRARKREKIVAISQAEMMFIIAAVMLVLFMLAFSQRQAAESGERAARAELAAAREVRGEESSAQDMLAEVNDVLTAEGVFAADSGATPPRLREEIPDAVRELARQKNESESAQKEIDAALAAADEFDGGGEAENVESRPERIRRLLKNAARGEAAARALGIEDSSPESIAAEIEKLRRAAETKTAAARNAAAETARAHKLRFGFLPCWIGGGAGEPPYYFALEVEYRAGRYNIAPHPHLRARAAAVRSALADGLGFLSNPPSGWIDEDAFAQFGRRARAQKIAQYPNAPDCQLIAKINRGAGGHQIVFVRDVVGFYPIYE